MLVSFIKRNYFLFKLTRDIFSLFNHWKLNYDSLPEYWKERIMVVKECPDNDYIDKDVRAGNQEKDKIIMHNGLKVYMNSYYGEGVNEMLHMNSGIHEPQEEKAFQEVLEYLPKDSVMVELGAFWGFYSMWFKKNLPEGTCYLFEPDSNALLSGMNNFKLNKLTGNFNRGRIGDYPDERVEKLSIDGIINKFKIPYIHLLHSDIQGAELDMISNLQHHVDKIGYIFISTHSNEIHYSILDILKQKDFSVLCECDLDKTYSHDGLIVAKSDLIDGPDVISISKRTPG